VKKRKKLKKTKKDKMLTTNNAAAMSANDKRNQMMSHVALCPALYLFLMGVISLQFLFPWNAATFVGNSGDWDMATNSTYQQAYVQWEHQPCASDEVKMDGKNCVDQIFHPYKEFTLEETTATGQYQKVKTRGDWWNCDLPSNCHMRYMYQEEARNAGIYYIGMGVMAIYALISKSHYAARSTSGLHLFVAVYSILHALALVTTYSGLMDRDEQMVPYLYRQHAARTITMVSALIFLLFGVFNIVVMVFGMMRAGELTANARAANIASSGLVAQFGTAEFGAMDGGNKGKQTVSTAGMCCLGLWVLIPCLFFTWIWSYGVTFRYYGSGDMSNLFHENATWAQGAEFMYNLYPKTKKVDGNDVEDCDGLGESSLLLDTGLKKTGDVWPASGSGGIDWPLCGTSSSGSNVQSVSDSFECTRTGSNECTRNAACSSYDAVAGQHCICMLWEESGDVTNCGTSSTTGPSTGTTGPCTGARRLQAEKGEVRSFPKANVDRRRLSSLRYQTFILGANDAIHYVEPQKCKGIHKDFGAENFHNFNDDGPVWMIAYHTVRQQAKFSGAFYWATAIA
jgi:hypothetical protein